MVKGLILRALALVMLAGTYTAISGCNTMAGAGQDIENGGRAMKNEAREQQQK